jgi:poly-gamma-glutamate synthesis protein (capsule biosynthesis protein)
MNDITPLFDNGKIEFTTNASGENWTFTATGDYGIIPGVAENVSMNGIEPLAAHIKELIKADVSIANLEVGLTSADKIEGRGVRGDRELFLRLHEAVPFTAYSFANNHVRDAGADELAETFDLFRSKNIPYIGGGRDKSEAESPLFINCKGIKLGILAFAQRENQIAEENTPGAAELITDKVLNTAEELITECDVPIVIMHEGYEFLDFPRLQFMELCRKLARLGIKLVIGHHSHTPQGIEKIDDSLIFYSLGNFLFDQPHFKPYPWSRRSFVPAVSFTGKEIAALELRPFEIELKPLDIRPANKTEREVMFEHLKENSLIISDEDKLREGLEKFYTNILLPEFLGFITNYGNDNKKDFSKLIERFKGQKPVHNLFADFLAIYGE